MPFYSKPSISTHAPALFLLPGMVVGLLLAQRAPHAAGPGLLLAAVLLGALSLALSWRERCRPLWLLCFSAALGLSFWSYGALRLPPAPDRTQLARPIREAQLEFEVLQVMQARSRYGSSSGTARILQAAPLSRLHSGDRIYFRVDLPAGRPLQRGLKIRATGLLRPIAPPQEPGGFDAYLKSRGIHYAFTRSSQLTVSGTPSGWQQFCQRMNLRLQQALQLGAPPGNPIAHIYPAMLLGRKAELSPEQSERFRSSGSMHFFAISGLHIGVIASVIAQLLILLRVPRRFSPWIGLPLLYLYVEITGASPSAMRAFLMAACFWASYALCRQRSALGALAVSAVGVLLVAPEQLWRPGFQLSYCVVLSILLLGLPLHGALLQHLQPYQLLPSDSWTRRQHATAWAVDKLLLLFAISSSAWLASAPLCASLFGIVAPGAVLLNMLLVYFATLVIIGGVVSIAFSLIGLSALSAFLNHAAWLNLSAMDALAAACTRVPGAVLHSGQFPQWLSYLTALGYFALLVWLHRDPLRPSTRALLLPPAWVLALLAAGLLC